MARDTVVSRQPNAYRNTPIASDFRRDQSLDIAKGIGIVLVVLGHCLDGLKASNFFSPTLLWPTLAIYVIYLFHMPLFFVVSGHLTSGKHRPVKTTLARLVPSIVYPYFLWSILQGLVQVYLTKYTTSHVPISVLYKILWIPIVPYWFLYALFFCHVGYLVIRRFSHPVQFGIAFAIFSGTLFFIDPLSGAHLQIVMETVHGFLFFVIGVISVSQVRQLGLWAAIAASVLFVLLAMVFYQSQWSGAKGSLAVLPAALAGIVATLAWSRLLAAKSNRFSNTLAFLGRYSMSIYVMHIFFTAAVRIVLKRLGTEPTVTGTLLEIIAATALGVALPLAINWLISKFELDSWFGIQHMETN
jgi:fucose 4-O-acetylase-like acetyltransferase